MIRVGIIGLGHWGPNHLRVFSQLGDSTVTVCCDSSQKRVESLAAANKDIRFTTDLDAMLASHDLDAVVIATPTATHFEVATKALEAGKHVLCEKPLTEKVDESVKLAELASEEGLVLSTGFVFLFNPGIRRLKQFVSNRELGNIYYCSAVRTNLGPVRNDVNCVFDLASHDISIFNYLLNSVPETVSASGQAFLQPEVEDVAFITLKYPKNIVCSIRASWLDPRKVRQVTVVGDESMALWDDLGELGPVILYDAGIVHEPYYESWGAFKMHARKGEVRVPKVPVEEPLRNQGQAFLNVLKNNEQNVCCPDFAVGITKVLCAIKESMDSNGEPVKIG
jgi:predicted dehydrogenase